MPCNISTKRQVHAFKVARVVLSLFCMVGTTWGLRVWVVDSQGGSVRQLYSKVIFHGQRPNQSIWSFHLPNCGSSPPCASSSPHMGERIPVQCSYCAFDPLDMLYLCFPRYSMLWLMSILMIAWRAKAFDIPSTWQVRRRTCQECSIPCTDTHHAEYYLQSHQGTTRSFGSRRSAELGRQCCAKHG